MNIAKLMKQAQEMQEKLKSAQDDLVNVTAEGAAGGGMVKVVLNGKGEMTSLKIEEGALDPTDPEIFEDLIIAAHADAKKKVEEQAAKKMAQLTAGLPLPPGFNFPGF